MTTPKHKWEFRKYLRANAYGWSGSAKASKRIKEAISEIKKVHKTNQEEACEGIVILFEKLVPSLAQIDSSSGAIGTAVYNAIDILSQIFGKTDIQFKKRAKWLERIYDAYIHDRYGHLDTLGDHFGTLCRDKNLAESWAFRLRSKAEASLPKGNGYFKGTVVCLDCLIIAEKYEEVLEMLDKDDIVFWSYRVFGVRALAKLGKIKEAMQYAQQTDGVNKPQRAIDYECEKILKEAGRTNEAYKFALSSCQKTTNLATFRAVKKEHPYKKPREILDDLIERSHEKGKWFATAKEIKEFDLALSLIDKYPCDPITILRASEKHKESNPIFALNCAVISLKWMSRGHGYELQGIDVITAYCRAIALGKAHDKLTDVENSVRAIVTDGNQFVKSYLEGRLK